MPKLSRISGKKLIKLLEGMGFKRIRQHGGHVVLKKEIADGKIGCVSAVTSGISNWNIAWHFKTGKDIY